jgi:hypothetical protein
LEITVKFIAGKWYLYHNKPHMKYKCVEVRETIIGFAVPVSNNTDNIARYSIRDAKFAWYPMPESKFKITYWK